MVISEQDYWLKPGESIDAYNTRIAALRGETPSSTSTPTQGTTVPLNSTTINPTTGLTNEQMYNQTNDIVAQAKAMLKQTELQGEIPFTGSPFDNSKIISSYLTNNPITPTIPKTTTYATTTPTELGEETTKAQTYSEKLMELNKQLEGKTAEEIRLKEELGVNTQQSVVDDLNTQMEMLNNKASNIPLQLEREAAGRGLTSSQLSRQQARDLRDVAIEQLITSSSLSAAKNKLTDAKNKVTEAMNAKYGPILEQIETAKTNLDIILKSPKYTIEEKDRAQAQKDKEEAKKEAVKVAEEDEKNKLNLINSLYTHAENMTPQQLSDLVLKLQDDKITYEQAQYIVAQSGVMRDKAGGTTSDQKAIQYNLVKQRVVQVGQDGLTADEYQGMRDELIAGGLGSYLDDFEKVAFQYLSYEDRNKVGIQQDKRFLNKESLTTYFTEDQLKTAAKTAGYRGFLTSWSSEKEKYLTHLMEIIEQNRKNGYSDQEIYEMLSKKIS